MLFLIPLLPLIGFLINGTWYAFFQTGKNQKPSHATIPGIIASLMIFGSFLVSLKTFISLKEMTEATRVIEQNLFSWIAVGDFKLDVALRVDSLSTLFTLVITGVGTLIHIYSIGYMGHDETPGKFFSYLNLFCFSMLILVMGSSLPILFFGWEGVGLCSYLLIGYWYTDMEKASAGKKAFIVNRIGDFGFLLGMFFIYSYFGSLDLSKIVEMISNEAFVKTLEETHLSLGLFSMAVPTVICLLLFVGCTGKSAQIPLYVWLPDAMAGPTPVSALIHAATMVTSGVYLLARLNGLLALSHTAQLVIAIVGGLTAFFAASIAFAQNDIKKVLAYSTVSQLGYMFLACGVGAVSAGVLHVITHAFFKALMFLGAGSVIHGMHEEQDMLKMGGLKNKMPVTYVTFIIGWLAIIGFPGLSGFFSKDDILWNAYANPHGSKFLWVLGVLTAMMTAFYMTRLMALTFWGKSRVDEHTHPHESPAIMTIPLIILALFSITAGYIGIPTHWLEEWLSGIIPIHNPETFTADHHTEIILMCVSTVLALSSALFAYFSYRNLKTAEDRKAKFKSLHHSLENKWFIDEIYEAFFVRPIKRMSISLWKGFDIAVIDNIVLGFGRISLLSGRTARLVQTGSLQIYILLFVLGMVLTVGYFIYGMV